MLLLLTLLYCLPSSLAGGHHASFDKRLYTGPADVSYTWVVNENIVNFYQPANMSQRGGAVPETAARYAILVNNSYPGPPVRCNVGQIVNITLINNLMSDNVAVHFHGIHQTGSPWSDGVDMVSQCPIAPGGATYNYVWKCDTAGTYFWHSHVGLQLDYGLAGAIIVTDPNDPHRNLYESELDPILVGEWYREPLGILKAPGYKNFHDLQIAHINGWGATNTSVPDGQKYSPLVIEMVAGHCHRVRFINGNGEFAGWQVNVTGHTLTLINLDSEPLQPMTVNSFAFYGGNRVDAVLCADQPPGEYPLVFSSVQQISDTCRWWPDKCQYTVFAILRYKETAIISKVDRNLFEAFPFHDMVDMMKETRAFQPLPAIPVPAPTRSVKMQISFLADSGPSGTLAFSYSKRTPWESPDYPLLFDATQPCGLHANTHVETITSEDEVLEIIFENLSDLPHNMHMHGGDFWVLGTGFTVESQWQGDPTNQTLCNGSAIIADPAWAAKSQAAYQRFWGCPFSNTSAARAQLNTQSPYLSDIIVVPPRSWAVVRINMWNPGVWPFHCHVNHHAIRGMMFVLNVLPQKQPPLPDWVNTQCGSCPRLKQSLAIQSQGTQKTSGAVVAILIILAIAVAGLVGVLLMQRLKPKYQQLRKECSMEDGVNGVEMSSHSGRALLRSNDGHRLT